MPSSKLVTLLSLALAPLVLAHFVVNTPPRSIPTLTMKILLPVVELLLRAPTMGLISTSTAMLSASQRYMRKSFLAYRGILGTRRILSQLDCLDSNDRGVWPQWLLRAKYRRARDLGGSSGLLRYPGRLLMACTIRYIFPIDSIGCY